MRCVRCKSINTMKFVDGFGEHRIFCKSCRRSFLQNTFVHFGNQKNLMQFDNGLYYKPQAIRVR